MTVEVSTSDPPPPGTDPNTTAPVTYSAPTFSPAERLSARSVDHRRQGRLLGVIRQAAFLLRRGPQSHKRLHIRPEYQRQKGE